MRVVLLGAPGAGKGTYAEELKKHYHIPHISSGDEFRAIKKQDSDLGRRIIELEKQGKLLDDATIMDVVAKRLSQTDCKNGYLLDGFPRTLYQAEHYDEVDSHEVDVVLYFNASEQTIVKRLMGRRVCDNPKCSTNYNIETNPPKKQGLCDICGGHLSPRKDDNLEVIKKRLEVYHKETSPLVPYYEELGLLVEIDANGGIADIVKDCIRRLDKYR
jgi:adenylate kinase